MQDLAKLIQKSLHVSAIVFVSVISALSIINVLGKESQLLSFFVIFHVFLLSVTKSFNLS